MNKQPNNNDFQDLFQIYTESCGYNKDEEKEKEDEELATEEADEETEEETEEETGEESEEEFKGLEEGLFDRLKAKGSGAVAGAKTMAGNVKNVGRGVGSQVKHNLMGTEAPKTKTKPAKRQNVETSVNDKKVHSILSSHIVKLDKALSNLATDVTKLGVMEASEAEQLAQQISTQINKAFVKKTKGRALTSKGRKNF